MQRWFVAFLLFCAAGCATPSDRRALTDTSPAQARQAAGPTHPDLRTELLTIRAEDQELRMQWIAEEGPNEHELARQVMQMDAAHTARMREIVDEHGWPTRSMVGKDGAAAAWLIVQHASADVAFQRRCLELMRPLVERNEVSAVSVAYLTDRVRMLEGRPQLYGTQFQPVDGGLEPFPIEDPDHVDERRAELGLEPLAEYKAQMMRSYGLSAPDERDK